jgi:hypothetical protein
MRGDNKQFICGRREFMRSSARYGLLSALGALLAFLGLNSRGGSSACVRRFACGACPRLARCDLPAANKTREKKEARG